MTFTDSSKGVLKDFISSVLYIDDNIFTHARGTVKPGIGLVVPTRVTSATMRVPETVEEKVEAGGESVDVSLLTKAFARHGIVCGLWEPEDEELQDAALLRKADIVILDWSIGSDDGKFACSAIKKLEEDLSKGLHLLVIWTNDPDKEDILGKVCSLSGAFQREDNSPVININKSRIIYVNKKKASRVGEFSADEDELPALLLDRMSEMTAGLVSNTAIKAIDVLKKCSAKVLAHFNKDLDGAYLAHRAMCPNPADAETLLLSMLADTFRSLISSEKVGALCDADSIERYLEQNEAQFGQQSLCAQEKKFDLTLKDYIDWQRNGFKVMLNEKYPEYFQDPSPLDYDKIDRNNLKRWACRVFHQKGSEKHGDFALLSTVKNIVQHDYVAFLTLGTIVEKVVEEEGETGAIYMCLQQRCDSVRISGERSFLFLPIVKHRIGSTNDFIPVIVDSSQMYVSVRTFDLSVISFKESGEGMVQAVKDGDAFYFTDESGVRYKWHYDLKDAVAQQISEKYSSNLSRVGIDQSEWLRRN